MSIYLGGGGGGGLYHSPNLSYCTGVNTLSASPGLAHVHVFESTMQNDAELVAYALVIHCCSNEQPHQFLPAGTIYSTIKQ